MMDLIKRKVVAITSLPTLGNAGLQSMMPVLGSDIIPVPTVILTGLGNMPKHKRYQLPFQEVLEESCQMAIERGFRLIFYTGYFQAATQIEEVLKVMEGYQAHIDALVVDPVSGDNGKAYVDRAIIEALPKLLDRADWALPNLTEVALTLGEPPMLELHEGIKRYKQRFPQLKLIITGIHEDHQINNIMILSDKLHVSQQPYWPQQYAGTGDAFAALFIRAHYLNEESPEVAVEQAGEALSTRIYESIEQGREGFDLGK